MNNKEYMKYIFLLSLLTSTFQAVESKNITENKIFTQEELINLGLIKIATDYKQKFITELEKQKTQKNSAAPEHLIPTVEDKENTNSSYIKQNPATNTIIVNGQEEKIKNYLEYLHKEVDEMNKDLESLQELFDLKKKLISNKEKIIKLSNTQEYQYKQNAIKELYIYLENKNYKQEEKFLEEIFKEKKTKYAARKEEIYTVTTEIYKENYKLINNNKK